MRWADVIDVAEKWADDCRDLSKALRHKAASVYTRRPGGYFYRDGLVFIHGLADEDFRRCKTAAARVVSRDYVWPEPLTDREAASGHFVKIAYSPVLRRIGEWLNFFPGKYPGGIPNAPSPLAAMLTTALVGGGLGYAGGALAEKVLPTGYAKNLKKTTAALGAGLGGSVATPWLAANALTDKPINDASLLGGEAGADPEVDSEAMSLSQQSPPSKKIDFGILSDLYDPRKSKKQAFDLLDCVPLGSRYKTAVDAFVKQAWGTFGVAQPRKSTQYDVNINALGQTLWDTGASPALSATTMGAMYAAQQLPDEDSRPGFATSHQLGQLAMNAGKDYAKGLLFGAVINKTLGTPYATSQLGLANVGLGIIQAATSGLLR